MKKWSTAMAVFVAGAMLAGPAYAQTTTPSSEQKDTTGSAAGKSDSMKSDSAMKSPRASRGAASREHVKAAQQALKDKGHDPGPIDGKMGPKTHAALRDFQSKEGLKSTGRLDNETMAKLGIEATSGIATPPAASPSTTTSPSSGTK